MVFNDQFFNPFSTHDNISMDNFSAHKLHTKNIPDGLDYTTTLLEQERMFKYARQNKTIEIFSKYQTILKDVKKECINENKIVKDNIKQQNIVNKFNSEKNDDIVENSVVQKVDNDAYKEMYKQKCNITDTNDECNTFKTIINDSNISDMIDNNNNAQNTKLNDDEVIEKNDSTDIIDENIMTRSYIFDCIQVLSKVLKQTEYADENLLSDVLQLRKMYLYEKQKNLKELILPFLQEKLSSEELLQANEYKNTTNPIKDAIELIDIEKRYETKQKEKEKENLLKLRKEIKEIHKKQIENEFKEYEKIKRCYASIYNLHNSIERKKDEVFTRIRKYKEKDDEVEKRAKYNAKNDINYNENKENEEGIKKQDRTTSTSDINVNLDDKNKILNEILIQKDDERMRIDIFLNLPSKRKYPDYYKTIKTPMCINLIKKRLKTKGYGIEEMKNDLLTMFDNALEYNTEESQVYQDAIFYKNLLDSVYSKYSTKNN